MAFARLLAFSSLLLSFSTSQAALTRRVTCPDGSTTANQACCAWFPVRDFLQTNLFNNECGQDVREALRLTFHDGVGFSPSQGGGGSDGSIITFPEELNNSGNDGGVTDAVDFLTPLVSQFNVTAGDLIYFASAVGITNCPGAPQLEFLTGRPPATGPAPDNTVSLPTDSADTILARFSELGFDSDEVVALLSSHSIAAADALSGPLNGDPFDSTPAVFDSQFFVETILDSPVPGAITIPSDRNLATDPRTACTWQNFIENEDDMRAKFAAAMLKLSLVQQTQSSLIDCSDVIPGAKGTNDAPYFPGTKTVSNVDQVCTETPFPTLIQNAAVTTVTPVREHTVP